MEQAVKPSDPPDLPLNLQQDTYDQFYLRIHNRLVARAIVLGCPRDSAPELVQDVLIKIWERWEAIDWRTRSNYTFVALHREVISRFRQAGIRQRISFGFMPGAGRWNCGSDVEKTVMDGDEAAQAMKFIKEKLSPQARHIMLRIIEGYTPNEVARELGLKPSTARNHLLRARRLVKDYLEGTS
ncbi:RNA polymerase sigma factor [Actinoplanes couchii]|uniref:RNA polymerase sigma factor 70 region 4 type 2 domain-containing protein n=1 Tax=Actinoplanes couchii TaxID=403638 RepID=A0ABQ3XKA6_9ACTN|nr:sigma-70 family RNA polymerase sigma factor [Actinoplanes couchii]MDR6320528.1 RNA polymerase sigma-70 factor (ECF subfamily) [Actinoplanes couchii]GID58932.1 hypothetical protein Aco03nite_073360 [Actinoplanes couchii]